MTLSLRGDPDIGIDESASRPSRSALSSLTYAAMSALVAWHTLAMVIAAAPDSAIARSIRELFHPYLTMFRLDNKWGFFAPNVDQGYQFRYVVEDAAGQRHTFIPAANLSRLHPESMWIRDWYKTVIAFPEVYGDAAAAWLCRHHAAMNPKTVTLLEVEQQHFLPADRMSGPSPRAPQFIKVNTLKTVRCSPS
jgi:hypothetical protein